MIYPVLFLAVLLTAATTEAADRVIVLTTAASETAGQVTVTAAYWFPVTAGEELPRAGFVSAFDRSLTAIEREDLQTGRVVEEVITIQAPDSDPRPTLEAKWTARKAERDALPTSGKYYGRTWDGTTWRSRK